MVRGEAALGEPHEAHKSNADRRLEACIHCPSLALQASILATLQLQKAQSRVCYGCRRDSSFVVGATATRTRRIRL
jgi:hypothetical protein